MRRRFPLLLSAALTTALIAAVFSGVPAHGTAPADGGGPRSAPAHAGGPAPGTGAAAAGHQPYASYWYPRTLLDWDPATDPDARFNRSRVPLRPRTSDPALKANANARAGEARIASLVSFGPTSANPSQGSTSPNYYAPGYWQYVDTLVFWGGSAGEGLILAPNPTVIDAAHRNGVKVYGTVFFPPAAYGGQIQWVRDFTQKSGTTYPVADKLVEVARYYGFDGWFINQETGGGDAALATELRDTMRYARSRGPVEFMWYDSMTESGPIDWANALTSANDAFLQEGTRRTSDSMFLNFGWSASGLASSRTLARALGRDEHELYAGVDTEADGYDSPVGWDSLFPNGAPHVASLGLYRPEWTYNTSATDRAGFHTKDSRYWVGANADPSNTATTSAWKGLAHYIAESSPVTSKPFVTSFNAGQGDFYHSAGTRVGSAGWNNLSLQDVPPTYRWLVGSGGTRLTPSIDFTDAYEGGSSLRLTGPLDSVNTIRLYQTKLPVAADTRLSVTVRTPAAGPTRLGAAVSFTDAPTAFTTLDLGSTTGTGWETKTLDLSAHAGRTIAQIGLRTSGTAPSYDIRVGQIRVYDGTVDGVSPPTAPTVLGSTDVSATRRSLRLAWTAPAGGDVHHYEVFRRDPDGGRTFLGATPNDAYFVQRLDRVGAETTTTLDVEAVSTEYGRSAASSTTVSWGAATGSNLALNRPATASGRCNAVETPAKAVNGSVGGGNGDKWCALTTDKHLEVDLGSVRNLTRFTVRHAGAGGESAAWNTRDFTVQVRAAATDAWTTAVTVTGNTAAVTDHPVGLAARHVRLVVTRPAQTADPAARIYEFEAWGT
ncbi:discoidin domain-containing protein [Streptomyces sp. NPDC002057]|uniref:endo-beta-N-acetylglucosaminidase n=1 Tax=Streptomyces sp. NPDC002057 TaxID=3154664 RepID=UPI003326F67C